MGVESYSLDENPEQGDNQGPVASDSVPIAPEVLAAMQASTRFAHDPEPATIEPVPPSGTLLEGPERRLGSGDELSSAAAPSPATERPAGRSLRVVPPIAVVVLTPRAAAPTRLLQERLPVGHPGAELERDDNVVTYLDNSAPSATSSDTQGPVNFSGGETAEVPAMPVAEVLATEVDDTRVEEVVTEALVSHELPTTRYERVAREMGVWTARGGLDPSSWVIVDAPDTTTEATDDPNAMVRVGGALRASYDDNGAVNSIEQRVLLQNVAGDIVIESSWLGIVGDDVRLLTLPDDPAAAEASGDDTERVARALATMETVLGLDRSASVTITGEVMPVEVAGSYVDSVDVLPLQPDALQSSVSPELDVTAGAPLEAEELVSHGIPVVPTGSTVQELHGPLERLSAIWSGFSRYLEVRVSAVDTRIAEQVRIFDTSLREMELIRVSRVETGEIRDAAIGDEHVVRGQPVVSGYYLSTCARDENGNPIMGTGRTGHGRHGNGVPVQLWRTATTPHRVAQLAIERTQQLLHEREVGITGVTDLMRMVRAYRFAHATFRDPLLEGARIRERQTLVRRFMLRAGRMEESERQVIVERIRMLGATRREMMPLARGFGVALPEPGRARRAARMVRQVPRASVRRLRIAAQRRRVPRSP